jgi:hypothetical protein
VSWSANANVQIVDYVDNAIRIIPNYPGWGSLTATIQTPCGSSTLSRSFWVGNSLLVNSPEQVCLTHQQVYPFQFNPPAAGGSVVSISSSNPSILDAWINNDGSSSFTVQAGWQPGYVVLTFGIQGQCESFTQEIGYQVVSCNNNDCCNAWDNSCCVIAMAYPNPAGGGVQIEITDHRAEENALQSGVEMQQMRIQATASADSPQQDAQRTYQLRVRHSQTGVVALEQDLGAVLQPVQFNVSGWAKGVYVVEVSDGTKVYFSRLVVE